MLGCTAVLGTYIPQHSFGHKIGFTTWVNKPTNAGLWRSCGNWRETTNVSKGFGAADEPALFACDVTCVLIPTTKPTTWCNIWIMKFHSFLELSCTNLSFMLFNLWWNWNIFSCLIHLSELSWTVLDWDLTTNCLYLDHMWGLSESKALHADTWLIRARSCLRLFLDDACKLLDQTWSGCGILALLLGSGWIGPFGVFGGGSGFVIMFIKTFVTTSALSLGMIDAWGFSHFFFRHLLPLIILIAPWWWTCFGSSGWLSSRFIIFDMLEWTLLPLITGTLLELIANLVTFATSFLRSTATWRALSAAATIAFGGCGLCVLNPSLVLLRNAVPVLP